MFAYCANDCISNVDHGGNRYCAATSVQEEDAEERSESCQHQNQISIENTLRDVTKEVFLALTVAANEARAYVAGVKFLFGENLVGTGIVYLHFYTLVDHEALWDIKRAVPWETTIGTPFPGIDVPVKFLNGVATPEGIGNYAYGFLGYAYGIPIEHLIGGSYYAADFPTKGSALTNELGDWYFIFMGYANAQAVIEGG